MKKILLLTTALGLVGASSLTAATVDVFITGSTAFRANVYNAAKAMYTSTPNIYYADAAHGGANGAGTAKTAGWTMTGTPLASLTALSGDTLVIHGLFTGSVQGLQTTEQGTKLVFAAPSLTATDNQNADTYVTNVPTIGFSDASASSTPYPVPGNFLEEQVCVQPFVWCTSRAASGGVTEVTNITWEQVEYGLPVGRIPLASWTFQVGDTNKFVYLLQRTKDSGTRRTETQGAYYSYSGTATMPTYMYDVTNHAVYTPSVLTNYASGIATNGGAGVIGTEGPGLGNANMGWGFGYIGGGDIATALGDTSANDQCISYLSIGDSQKVNGSVFWQTVISYNGIWPTAAGPGIHGNPGVTNDFSPITLGYYPLWGFEILVHPENTSTPGSTISGQDLTYGQLGDNTQPASTGSFMSIFNAQSFNNGNVATVGSIENDIILSQPAGATAITLAAMSNSRPNVGGTIYPAFQ